MANDPSDLVSRRSVLAGTGAAAAFGFAGCIGGNGNGGNGGSGNGGSSGNGGGSGGLSGTIDASGSNTVAPITSWAGENFQNEYPDVLVDVDPQGTGAGFQEFCRANSDVQSASRLITDEEIALCDENNVNYEFLEVGLDGLAVVKNSENDWVDNITLSELEQIWTFQSDVELWSDVRSEWPDREIALHARDSASGTFDYFTLEISGEVGNIRDDYSATSQTNEIMGAVADNVDGFGWGGVGYLRSIEDDQPIEAVPVESDQDGEFYLPEEENIESGAYSPLARPLFIYVNHAGLEEQPDLIGSFCRYFFNNQADFARDEGFYAAPDEEAEANHERLNDVLDDLGIDGDELTIQPT